MEEAAITDVDADMVDLTAATAIEEDQVACLQLIARHTGSVESDHLAGRARQPDAGLLAEQEADEAATVERNNFV